MPRKICELITELESAGFFLRGDRGSHRNFVHPRVTRLVTLPGQPGDDAKHYQERAVCSPRHRGITATNIATRYVKIVEWSEEDQCFVGSCPGLFYGGCHGDDEQAVFAELCRLVEETIEQHTQDGRPLPAPTAGKDYANQMLNVG